MKPEYPKCPESRNDDCRFLEGTRSTTCLHSPLIYNRKGEAVGGGANVSTKILHCTACGQNWSCSQSDLDAVKGIKPVWEPVRRS